MRGARDEDALSVAHRVSEDRGGARCDRSGRDEAVEVAERGQELPHVHGPVPAGDVGDDDVEATAVGKRRVDERLAQVDPATGGLQHPLDEIAHRGVGEGEGNALRHPGAGDEDAVGSVDPELLDGRVVEVRLQRAVARDGCEHLAHARRLVVDRRESAGQGEVVVAADLAARDVRGELGIAGGIGPLSPQPLAHALGDHRRGSGGCIAVAGDTGESSQDRTSGVRKLSTAWPQPCVATQIKS